MVSMVDRPKMEIMHWVNEGCVRAGVPFIAGGLETQRAVYFTVIPGVSGCIECWRLGVSRADPASFALIQEKGSIPIEEMYTVFNMGIGFCLIVGPQDVERVLTLLQQAGETACILGKATEF